MCDSILGGEETLKQNYYGRNEDPTIDMQEYKNGSDKNEYIQRKAEVEKVGNEMV